MNCQKLSQLVACLGLIALFVGGCGSAQPEQAAASTPIPPTPMARLDGKHVLFVVPDRFSDSEYRIPRSILEELGALVTVASWSPDALLGTSGDTVQPDLQLGDVRVGDYDAIVLVGGEGVRPTEAEVQRVVREAIAEGKVVAAICASQGILVEAGVVESGWVAAGSVERDGLIIMAAGPLESREFGETIAAVLGE